MAMVNLTASHRRRLRQLARQGRDARLVRRAQALLWLEQGEGPTEVAQRLGVTRQSVYNWVRRIKQKATKAVAEGLADRRRPGRPPVKRQAVQRVVEEVMEAHPTEYGYHALGWTSPLIGHHLKQTQGFEVSQSTVRRCLRQMGYRWKRPRYVLSRRSVHWRQAKGGLSVD